ncbi:MAG: DUF3048 C-terminal domain-containing protein [Clostridiales bacterium]|nr:DUF3048 C-terminal domain-containing protein [Clostridiales bacterium]
MKKWTCLLIAALLATSAAIPALASVHSDNEFTLPLEGTVLLNDPVRKITPNTPPRRNPIIPGESPTTGLSWLGFYLPMLVQYSNGYCDVKVDNKTVTLAGVGARAPWGAQYADVIYEGILYRTGETRMTFVFSDSLDDGNPVSVGSVRSARMGHVLLREEWQGGLVFRGGPEATDNDIQKTLRSLGVYEAGVAFDLETNLTRNYSERIKGVKAPENLAADIIGLRSLIPADYVSQPRAFLFADLNPYTSGYDFAYQVNLDWGDERYVSHFKYDELSNIYYRYSGDVIFKSFESAENRAEEDMIPLTFANVIIQRVEYEYVHNSRIMPMMQGIGEGNADIFIGGRYIPGYWVRKSQDEPTIYYDNQGNEIQLTRGKTFIAQFPPDCILTFSAFVD